MSEAVSVELAKMAIGVLMAYHELGNMELFKKFQEKLIKLHDSFPKSKEMRTAYTKYLTWKKTNRS